VGVLRHGAFKGRETCGALHVQPFVPSDSERRALLAHSALDGGIHQEGMAARN
jgi:hypothetical protein